MSRRSALAATLSTLAVLCLVAPPRSAALDLHCSSSGPGGSWASVGRSPSSSRVQEEEHDLKAPLLPLWTFDARRWSHVPGQQFVGQPLLDAGCAYVASHTGTGSDGVDRPGWVYALNTGYGEAVWQRRLEGGVRSALALSSRLVIAHVQGPAGPTLVALDRRTGATRWRTVLSRAPGARALASPVVVGSTIWAGVAGPHGASVLLDLGTGRILRSSPVAGVPSAAAVDVAGSRAYVPTADGLVVVDVDRRSHSFGRVVAHGPRVGTSATPNLVAGRVASVGDDGVLRVLTTRDVRLLAQVRIGVPGALGPTAATGAVVYGSTETPGTVWAVDVATGLLRWLSPIGDVQHRLTPVSLANGVVYTVDLTGQLVAVDAGTGLLLWKVPMTLGSETYAERTLSSAGVTVAEHLVLTASGERDAATQDGFVVAYGPARVSL